MQSPVEKPGTESLFEGSSEQTIALRRCIKGMPSWVGAAQKSGPIRGRAEAELEALERRVVAAETLLASANTDVGNFKAWGDRLFAAAQVLVLAMRSGHEHQVDEALDALAVLVGDSTPGERGWIGPERWTSGEAGQDVGGDRAARESGKAC